MITQTVSNLVRGILVKTFGNSLSQGQLDKVAQALCLKIKAMPPILRFAITALTVVFNAYGLVTKRKSFASQDIDGCARQMRQWQGSPLGLCREFLGFYEKMSVFIHLSLCPTKN